MNLSHLVKFVSELQMYKKKQNALPFHLFSDSASTILYEIFDFPNPLFYSYILNYFILFY